MLVGSVTKFFNRYFCTPMFLLPSKIFRDICMSKLMKNKFNLIRSILTYLLSIIINIVFVFDKKYSERKHSTSFVRRYYMTLFVDITLLTDTSCLFL